MAGRLTYLMNVSLDGFVETPDHSLDWGLVDEELHAWFNERMRNLEATLYGRRLYEVMAAFWPTADQDPSASPVILEFARIWNPMPKVVFSTTLERVEHNGRLVSGDVGPILDELRHEFSGDLGVAGPNLAGQFIRRGLVDVYQLVVHPVALGAGTRYWPQLEHPLALRLTETRRFESGAVLLSFERR